MRNCIQPGQMLAVALKKVVITLVVKNRLFMKGPVSLSDAFLEVKKKWKYGSGRLQHGYRAVTVSFESCYVAFRSSGYKLPYVFSIRTKPLCVKLGFFLKIN